MKILLQLTIGLIIITCATGENQEIQKNTAQFPQEERIYNHLKLIVECNACKPTPEELFLYYKLKNPDSDSRKQIEQYFLNFDKENQRKNLVISPNRNKFLEYDFSFSPPTLELPEHLKGRKSSVPYPLIKNTSGYRPSSAPINVKPGHQF